MEFAMASPGISTLVDRHSRRVLVDTAEWRDRLEQLAEMRRAAAASAPTRSAVVDVKPAAP
jgi:metal-dependent hydrolase (beta-lactamase superfamily II)